MSSLIKLSQDFEDVEESDIKPVSKNAWGCYGDIQLVGQGEVTNRFCGTFKSFFGCIRVELHNKTSLGGINYAGKIFARKVFCSCGKPSCPVCYKFGWAVRQAGRIELRLAEASKRFGQIEHIVATFPPKYYHLSIPELRKKAIQILKSHGIIGGNLIFHGFRYNLRKYWYFSPHFHVLGFILNGYHKCRGCKDRVCIGKGNFVKCDGFEARTRRLFLKDGCVVKVLGERKTVGGTAWYQLNHASILKGVVRFHVSTWFGVCSYRKLKVTAEDKKNVCPICQHDLVPLLYFGDKYIEKDRDSPDFKRDSIEDYMENGRPVWVERQRKKIW